MDTKALIDERVKLHEENKALLDKASAEKRTLTGEEQQEFDRKDERITEIRNTLDRAAKQEAEERSLAESRGRKTDSAVVDLGNTRERDVNLAFRAWACGEEAKPEEIEAAERLNFRWRRPQIELRALNSVTSTQGQATIPDEMMKAYYEVLKWIGRVRSVAEVFNTTTGAPLPMPKVNDTTNVGEIVADGGAHTTTNDPAFELVTLGSFKYGSGAVLVSWELLQDSSMNLPVYLGNALGTRIARKQNTDFTVGAGTTLPFGVATQASLGKTAAATNAITFDEVIDLYHSVDIAYRGRPSSAFMVHDTMAATLRKMKDSQGRYLWEMSVQVGAPDRMIGVPVIINNDMDSALSTNKRLVLYGDFNAYKIRDAGAVEVRRADELRMLNGQVVFLAFQRSDGNLIDNTAVKYLRTA
jgi:HK97 family phage major capsid protein